MLIDVNFINKIGDKPEGLYVKRFQSLRAMPFKYEFEDNIQYFRSFLPLISWAKL